MPLINPKLWAFPLGNKADVSDLPDNPQTGANIGKASLSQLFGQINQIPLNAGGVPPSRDDFNALFKILGDNIFYLQNGGFYLWANTQTYNKFAIVLHDGTLFKSLIDGNKNNQPSSTSQQWEPLIKVQSVNNVKPDAQGNISISIPSISGLASLSKDNIFSGNQTINKNLTVKGSSSFAGGSFSASPTVPDISATDSSKKVPNTKFVQDAIKRNAGAPTGVVVGFMGKTIPSGWLLCNGQNVSRTTYANLWTVLGKPNTGDKSTTFTLPNLTGRFLEGATTPLTVKNAGLPNVLGKASWRLMGYPHQQNEFTGAFRNAEATNSIQVATNAPVEYWKSAIDFNASRSNAIYGKSNTVQPNSVTTLFIIKV